MGFGDEGAFILADDLRTNNVCQQLRLDGNGFTDKGASAIFDSLKSNTTLTDINIFIYQYNLFNICLLLIYLR